MHRDLKPAGHLVSAPRQGHERTLTDVVEVYDTVAMFGIREHHIGDYWGPRAMKHHDHLSRSLVSILG